MTRSNRKGINYPRSFMKMYKKQKRKRLRAFPIDKTIKEQYFNNVAREF